MTALKVALIGTGSISQLHARALAGLPDLFDIQWVCDVNEQASAAFVERFQLRATCYADYQELLKQGKPDAAIVILPHFLHMPVARDLLAAGIPTLVEKPAVTSLAEARILRDTAAQKQVPILVGQTRRFTRDAAWLRGWAQSAPSPFGALETFEITAWQNIYSYLGGQNLGHWILDGKKAGGGIVISVAVHQIDLLRYLFGTDFSEVEASGRFEAPLYNGAESAVTAMLRMDNGAMGTLHGNYLAQRVPYCESMRAFGSSGSVVQQTSAFGQYAGEFYYASTLGKDTTAWNDQFNDFARVPAEEVTGWDADGFANQARNFYDVIVNGAAPVCSLDDNWNTLACIEAISEAMRARKTVTVQKD